MLRFRQLLSPILVFLLLAPGAPLFARTHKGEKLRNQARIEEQKGNLDGALRLAEQAYAEDQSDPAYQLDLRRLRFEAASRHVKVGQQMRAGGQLEQALAEFQRAYGIDPASDIAAQEIQRTKVMIERNKSDTQVPDAAAVKQEERSLTPSELARKRTQERSDSLLPVPELRPLNADAINLKMSNKPRVLFETIGKVAGINVLFDPEYDSQQQIRNQNIDLTGTTLDQALDQVAVVTKSFWKPLSANTIFVTIDNPQKRREYAEQVVKIYYLTNVTTPQEIQEIQTVIRTVTDVGKIFPYTAQNALVVRAEADTIALVDKIVADLDKPRAEALIDIIVMEVDKTFSRKLGLGIGTGGLSLAAVFNPRPGITTPGSGGTTTPTQNQNGSTTPVTASPNTAVPLANLARISSADYSVTNLPGAILEAVLNDTGTRILQTPQIRAVSNAKASLKIGDKIPTATGSFQPGIGGGAGFNPLVNTQFTFIDVGVNIEITPQVHEGGEVSLHLDIDVSQLKDRIDLGGISQPEIGQRKATLDLRLKDGEVNLIGGLLDREESRAITGIPGLVNIPILRRLFSHEEVDRKNNELMIAVVPHIVRGPDVTESNLRGVAAGNATTIKVNYAPRKPAPGEKPQGQVTTPSSAGPVPAGPPATAPPLPIPPADQIQPKGPESPSGPARVSFLPPSMDTQLSSAMTVTIYAENVTDMISAAAHLQFDPRILRINNIVTADLPQRTGPQLQSSKNILNDAGQADVSVSRGPGGGGVSGTGGLFTVVFQAIGRGNTQVTVSNVALQSSTNQPINATAPPPLIVNVK